MTETPEQLAEKVRAGIKTMASSVRLEADAALDALLAHLAEAGNGEDAAGRMLSAVNEQRLAAEADRDRYRDALGQLWADRESWYDAMGDDEAGLPSEYQEHVWGIVGDALDPEQKP